MLLPLLAICTALAAGDRAAAAPLSARDLDQLVARYFEADADERRSLEAKLGASDAIAAKDVLRWREKLTDAMRGGKKLDLSGTNFFVDEKKKLGKYIVTGKGGKALAFGLHGGGLGAGDAESAVSAVGDALATPGVLAIFPEVLRKTECGWGEEDTEKFVLDLLDAAKRTARVDTNRVYLTGHSMGGYGTWTIGARNADLFAGLAAFAGAATPLFEKGDESQTKVVAIEDGVLPNLRNLPIFVYQSMDDRNVPPWSNLFATAELDRLHEKYGGFDHVFEKVDGRAHALPEKGPGPGVKWAMQHVRDPRPKRVVWQPFRPWKRAFFWLWWDNPVIGALVDAELVGDNVIDVRTKADPTGLAILLDERMVDLSRPVVLKLNGTLRREVKVADSLAAMLATAAERRDPELVFRARVGL